SLLRVDFSFDYTLDELLSIDIKKSRILLIGELASFIMKFLGAPRREAEKRYRDTENKNVHNTGRGAHISSNQNIDSKAPELEGSTITPIDDESAEIVNSNGKFTKAISILHNVNPQENRVIPVKTIEGNALWEPALADGKHAVNINESHPFYKKIYGPYLAQNLVVEGLDDLLWALAEAENTTVSQSSIENYEDMRYTVSRILKRLVADLPDPELPIEE
ncbi:ATP-binding protein, partial [Bacteroides uniformis]